jgi:hypothetical protein
MSAGGYERDSDASLTRDSQGYGTQQGGVAVGTGGGAYGGGTAHHGEGGYGPQQMGDGYQRRPLFPVETRPSFMTSEFLGTILAIVALGITAGVMDIVDARLTWILTAAMVFGYVLSRGLAKAGTKSHAVDPRDQLLQRGDGGAQQQSMHRGPQSGGGPSMWAQRRPYGGFGYRSGFGGRRPSETRPFFMTSEFLGTVAAIIAVACTAAAMPNLGARLTWILIAAMVFTYVLSRGIAKAGTHSHSVDPRDQLLGERAAGREVDGGQGGAGESGTFATVETKPFFLTSEFVGTLLAIVAIAISAATIDILNVRLTWILITAMVCGYVFSRGLAKIGVKSHAFDPRDALMQRGADGGGNDRQQSFAGR